MKSVFTQFVSEMKGKGIDLIFVCHADSVKEGNTTVFQPKMTGGSYGTLMQVADMVGFMESINNKRTINFSPTDRNIGKNSAEFDVMNIPHYTDEKYPTFMADLISKCKEKMESLSESQKETLEKLNDYKLQIADCESISDLNEMLSPIQELPPAHKLQLEKVWGERMIALWDIHTDGCKSLKSFNDMIGEMSGNVHQGLKSKVWNGLKSKAEAKGFMYDGEGKKFIKDPTKAAATKEAETESSTS